MIPRLCGIWNSQIRRESQGVGKWGVRFVGTEFQFGMKKFWRWIVVMVEQQCE